MKHQFHIVLIFFIVFNKNSDQSNRENLDKCSSIKIIPGMRYNNYYHDPLYLVIQFKHGKINYLVPDEKNKSYSHQIIEVNYWLQQNNFIVSFHKKENDLISEDNIYKIWNLGINEYIDNDLVMEYSKADSKPSYIINYLIFC